ncbi:MAG: pyridoxal phosphate-dependent aminotransferase family protein [Chlorobiales bacterium]|jgi:8-amino-7-oxononanoate synthase|nr:pyridoxal phosphate-dependent aminotransferase family protein [Chlorobiales bacterium]
MDVTGSQSSVTVENTGTDTTKKSKDLFQKCYDFTIADDIKARGVYPYFRPIEENEGPEVMIEGRKVIMAGSNNYLGLTGDPRVKEAAINAIHRFGTSCSGSRYLTGTVSLHIELEEKLAEFFGKESVLLFSTGYQTGQGVIPTLVQRGEYVISDRDNHASLVVATLVARGATANVLRYKHNDMEDLERVLQQIPLEAGKLIATDGVFSVSGQIVDLPGLVKVAKKYNARILVDDAHSVGVIGKGGRGTASEFNLVDEVDLTMGTFSKSFASLGGFVAGDRAVINFIKHQTPALIFSASPTPASVAAALKALEVLKAEPERIDRLLKNADRVRQGLKSLGFKLMDSRTAIVSAIIGDQDKTLIFWRKLFDAGIFVNAFVRPGVMPGYEMLRTSYMSTHEEWQLDKIVTEFGRIGKELEVI